MTRTSDRTAQVPLFHYTITCRPDQPPAEQIVGRQCFAVKAVGYEDSEPWLIFNDVHGTVLTIRADRVESIQRSDAPVETREVNAL